MVRIVNFFFLESHFDSVFMIFIDREMHLFLLSFCEKWFLKVKKMFSIFVLAVQTRRRCTWHMG